MRSKKIITIIFLFFSLFISAYSYTINDYEVKKLEQCTAYVHDSEKYVMSAYFYPEMNYARFYFKVKEAYYYDVTPIDFQEDRKNHVNAVARSLGFYHVLYGQEKLHYQKSYFYAYEFIVYFEY